jgi:hypothetical protein
VRWKSDSGKHICELRHLEVAVIGLGCMAMRFFYGPP